MRPIKVVKIKVLGKPWKVKLWSTGQYEKHIATDSVAMCFAATKELHYCDSEITLENIRHELSHAFYEEKSFVALQLTAAQMEEFSCELMAKHCDDFSDLSKEILSKLKG